MQIGALHDGETPDYPLMLDAMHYVTHTPDPFHHPKEDLVFKKLKERDASARSMVDNLMEKHKALAEKGDWNNSPMEQALKRTFSSIMLDFAEQSIGFNTSAEVPDARTRARNPYHRGGH